MKRAPVGDQHAFRQYKVAVMTDIVEVDCLAIDTHGQLWSLPLLGSLLLAPDIADHVCVAVALAIEGSRKGGEHIWLLDVECGSHGGRTCGSVSTWARNGREWLRTPRVFFLSRKKIGSDNRDSSYQLIVGLGKVLLCMAHPCNRLLVETFAWQSRPSGAFSIQ